MMLGASIISLTNTERLVFVVESKCAYCAVWFELDLCLTPSLR